MISWPVDFVFLPAIGGLHGYLTNLLAIKLLFYPERPWRLSPLPWSIQGLLPKRQESLAISVGEAVERELLSAEDLLADLMGDEVRLFLTEILTREISVRLEERLPRYIPTAIRQAILGYLRETLISEATDFAESFLGEAGDFIKGRIKIGPVIAGKLRSLAVGDLEKLVHRVAGREIQGIVRLGLVLGIWIGLVQGLFLALLGR